ncbi:MAG TPA: Ig-like domain-containing protein, partial [Roseateles sp.]|nr:Ig-like domain-containing protein [Roseateles sp.]
SGVVGLMMAAKPALAGSQIESLLYSSALDLGDAGRDRKYGFGRVNAAAAVKAVLGTQTADTQAPTATITSLQAGSTVSGLVAVNVSASDNVGVSRVELRANGSVVASDSAAPYAFSWDSSKLPNGTASLSAYAYDAAGNVGSSAALAVNVANNTLADTTPPAVTIGNPANGSKVSGTVGITVQAADNTGSAALAQSLYIDGQLVASSTGATLSYKWNTRRASAGLHTIKATARDAAGNTGSLAIQVSK